MEDKCEEENNEDMDDMTQELLVETSNTSSIGPIVVREPILKCSKCDFDQFHIATVSAYKKVRNFAAEKLHQPISCSILYHLHY